MPLLMLDSDSSEKDHPMKQVASLRYDVIFKKAFSVPRVFSDFVSAILGKPVTFDHVETEKRFEESLGLPCRGHF
jgi:hypothetical protein